MKLAGDGVQQIMRLQAHMDPRERIESSLGSMLAFLKPFKATNTVEFTFEENGDSTTATWTMFGKNKFMCKAIGMFMNMDKMCGSQFEEGLANMKRIAEAAPREHELSKPAALADAMR